jgi:hypothetical protein
MVIEYHSKLKTEFYTNANKGRRWQLIEPFEFSVDGKLFTVPDRFWTDFASVPRLIWPIISPYDCGVGPIPHDFGYFTGYMDKAYWDHVLAACMLKDGITEWKRTAVFEAVNWFGGRTWNNYRKGNTKHLLYAVPVGGRRGAFTVSEWKPEERVRVGAARVSTAAGLTEMLWQTQIQRLTSQQQQAA